MVLFYGEFYSGKEPTPERDSSTMRHKQGSRPGASYINPLARRIRTLLGINSRLSVGVGL